MPRDVEIATWTSPTGHKFRRLRWRHESPRAALVIHHGHGEHAGRYDRMAEALADVPVDIHAYDARGHGESEGARGDAEGLDGLVDDFEAIFPHLLELTGTDRAFVLGHSMGGAVIGHYATTRSLHPAIGGLIFSSPALLIPRSPVVEVKLLIGKVLGKAFPRLTLGTGLSPEGISSVPAEVERYRKDPLVHDRISARMGVSLVGEAEQIPLRAGRITVPTLIYHGDEDPITDIEGTRAFARGVGTDDVKFVELRGLRHETHHESPEEAAKVFELLREFLLSRLGGSAERDATS